MAQLAFEQQLDGNRLFTGSNKRTGKNNELINVTSTKMAIAGVELNSPYFVNPAQIYATPAVGATDKKALLHGSVYLGVFGSLNKEDSDTITDALQSTDGTTAEIIWTGKVSGEETTFSLEITNMKMSSDAQSTINAETGSMFVTAEEAAGKYADQAAVAVGFNDVEA